MRILASELPAERSYRLITGLVVPRPIAWVTTLNDAGQVNVAPFSAFTFVSPKPPLMGISVGRKGGIYKDTAHNILRREEYVIHIGDGSLVHAIHESSREFTGRCQRGDQIEMFVAYIRAIHVAAYLVDS
jgi:flavin reductase (DIM6/NTAB) family NADH-FMN oxidoreductase RutF